MDSDKFKFLCGNLKHENKIKRRQALKELYTILTSFKIDEIDTNIVELKKLIGEPECGPCIIGCLHDVSEVNRNLVIKILFEMCNHGALPEYLLDMIFPSICNIMNSSIICEECEENKVDYFLLLQRIFKIVNKSKISYYADNTVTIIKFGLIDKYSEVILEASNTVILLSSLFNEKFKLFSDNFVIHLLKNITNRKFKIRMKVISALGCIFISGDSQNMAENINTLSKAIHDIPQVRMQLLEIGYLLATKMPDRYSFWPNILPLILFGLDDDDDEIKAVALTYWKNIGIQYEAENEDIKFQSVASDHEESMYAAPTIGCSELTRKSFLSMLISIGENIHDWLVDVRFQSIKLLFTCINGLREQAIQYSTRIMELILFSTGDSDRRIVLKAFECAKSLGRSVPPDVYMRSVEDNLWDEHSKALMVFSCLLSTTPSNLIKEHFIIISTPVKYFHIENQLTESIQEILLDIVSILLRNLTSNTFDADILFTLFYLMGAKNSIEDCFIDDVISKIGDNLGFDSREAFFKRHMVDFLTKVKESEKTWGDNCLELCIFSSLATFEEFKNNFELVSSILNTKIEKNSDPLVIFVALQTVDRVIAKLDSTETRTMQRQWAAFSIQELILTLLSWSPGKTSQSLRMTAISYLNSIIHSCSSDEILFKVLEPTLQFVRTLITDELKETRMLCCKFLEIMFIKHSHHFQPLWFMSALELLADRLDDKSEVVRQTASDVLVVVSGIVAFEQDAVPRMKTFMEKIQTFCMEKDENIRRNIYKIILNLDSTYSVIDDTFWKKFPGKCDGTFIDDKYLEQLKIDG